MSEDYLDVPGTVRMYEGPAGEEVVGAEGIKLVPAPSRDPNDPLNWSRGRKNLMLTCVCIYTVSAAILSSDLYSVFDPLSASTGLSLDRLNEGTGYLYLFIGISTLISQPCSLAFGKKPVYLISAFGAAGVNIWTAFAKGNGQWIASRLLLGFFISPSFTLIEVSIADVFFLHERSFPLGVYLCVLFTGASVGPLLSGYIYEGIGWKAIIWLSTGLMAIVGLLLVLLLEETSFQRDHSTHIHVDSSAATSDGIKPAFSSDRLSSTYTSKEATVENADVIEETDKKGISTLTTFEVDPTLTTATQIEPSTWPGPKFWKFVKPHRHAPGILLRGLTQPFLLMRLPLIWWGGLMYATYQICFNLIAGTSSGILADDPYNFSTSQVGLSFLSPLISAIPGAVSGGLLADKFVLRQARSNSGIAEAEHKLKLYIIPTVLAPIGLLMMGLGPYYGAHWIVYILGCFILNLVGPLATILTVAYAFDCFHPIRPRDEHGVQACAQDAAPYLLSIMLLAMCFTFGFNYAITPWCFGWGLRNFAISSAIIITVINASVFLVVKWGKRLRRSQESYYRWVINL
ncbi:hypothetical protein B9479_001622 [Cryptococcus floricola]|uniref:Major facilitator superfamily (MFS) profile domain-containing protein n=1 Tax=Cryptococcus floricola TaxID=2591691 RepID=A0A5D3B464_9TREE|nr:hypothetical protein B9479_001622 [Cryptococcus floricola]